MEEEFELQKAEMALLLFWHNHVHSYSPNLRQYDSSVHAIRDRTMIYYFMTEDLIEYFKVCNISNFTEVALNQMGVTSGTLTNWRKKWGTLWRKMHIFDA